MNSVKLRSYEKLEEENKELKIVLRKLSHEMGNALTVLGANIYYLEGDIKEGTKKFSIRDLKGDYTYICNLFKNLREYNHTEALDKRMYTVTELLDELENTFQRLNGSSEVKLEVHKHVDTDDTKIYADKHKIKQVLINILKNSIEAMKQKESSNSKYHSMEIVVRVNIEKGQSEYLHMEIRDNGIGISEKNIGSIFEPMFTHGKEDGTGLGLSVVKKIMEDHKGKIKAVSIQGKGTAMHIYFPLLNFFGSK